MSPLGSRISAGTPSSSASSSTMTPSPVLPEPVDADDDAVGGEVGGVIVDNGLGALAAGVDLTAEEEAFGGHQGECTEATSA